MVIGSNLSTLSSLLGDAPKAATSPSSAGASFSDLFQSAINNVDNLQSTADTGIGKLMSGNANADVGNVMVSVEKADIAFQLMMQVRNKVVSAYQDVEKMQF